MRLDNHLIRSLSADASLARLRHLQAITLCYHVKKTTCATFCCSSEVVKIRYRVSPVKPHELHIHRRTQHLQNSSKHRARARPETSKIHVPMTHDQTSYPPPTITDSHKRSWLCRAPMWLFKNFSWATLFSYTRWIVNTTKQTQHGSRHLDVRLRWLTQISLLRFAGEYPRSPWASKVESRDTAQDYAHPRMQLLLSIGKVVAVRKGQTQ